MVGRWRCPRGERISPPELRDGGQKPAGRLTPSASEGHPRRRLASDEPTPEEDEAARRLRGDFPRRWRHARRRAVGRWGKLTKAEDVRRRFFTDEPRGDSSRNEQPSGRPTVGTGTSIYWRATVALWDRLDYCLTVQYRSRVLPVELFLTSVFFANKPFDSLRMSKHPVEVYQIPKVGKRELQYPMVCDPQFLLTQSKGFLSMI